MPIEFSQGMKMAELLDRNPSLLGVFTRMGFSFGYGDSTVAEVCRSEGTDPYTFLLICKVYSQDSYRPTREELDKADISVIVRYLSLSHRHYLDVDMHELEESLGRMVEPCGEDTHRIIWKFFSDFREELHKHFTYEEESVFPNAGCLDDGIPEEYHCGVEETLEDLKRLVMTHLPGDAVQQEAYKVLSVINSLQDDIRKHILLEETALEGRPSESRKDSTLSSREKEVLVCVARGMLNKEIADLLNISVYTVITHRKNITSKTGIKTVAGLTVYALLNNMLDINSIE